MLKLFIYFYSLLKKTLNSNIKNYSLAWNTGQEIDFKLNLDVTEANM